jgi:bis(5'-nucleosidyl)-tetraphosphatase
VIVCGSDLVIIVREITMTQVLSEKKKNKRRAGVIVVKDFDGEYLVLCLRVYGSYDLPKGGVEDFETDLSGALRETEEESGIADLDFKWGLESTMAKNVTLYIAETQQEPVIRPNPKNGVYEHHGTKWMTFKEASKRLHPYLRPSMTWAESVVMGGG